MGGHIALGLSCPPLQFQEVPPMPNALHNFPRNSGPWMLRSGFQQYTVHILVLPNFLH